MPVLSVHYTEHSPIKSVEIDQDDPFILIGYLKVDISTKLKRKYRRLDGRYSIY